MTSTTSLHPASTRFPFLRQAVIGLSDGVIIPFVITTSFSVLASGNDSIRQAGLVSIAVGAVFMGLAGYFAARNRQQNFATKTPEEEDKLQKEELFKTVELFKKLNLSKDMQEQAAVEIAKDSKEWNAYLDEHLSELEISEASQLPRTALIIALSYIAGGCIPLLPYLLLKEKEDALLYSVVASLAALLVLGFIKSNINREPLFWGTIRLMLLGGVAAAAGFAVAKIFLI